MGERLYRKSGFLQVMGRERFNEFLLGVCYVLPSRLYDIGNAVIRKKNAHCYRFADVQG